MTIKCCTVVRKYNYVFKKWYGETYDHEVLPEQRYEKCLNFRKASVVYFLSACLLLLMKVSVCVNVQSCFYLKNTYSDTAVNTQNVFS